MDVEQRLGALERQLSVLAERDTGRASDVRDLNELPLKVVRLESTTHTLKDSLLALNLRFDRLEQSIKDRIEEQSDERRALKVALMSLVGVILAALIGAGAVLLAHGA